MDTADIRRYHPIDVHSHVKAKDGRLVPESARLLLDVADTFGIEKICISRPLLADSPAPEECRAENDAVFEAMAMSDRFMGFRFVNPGYAREAIEETDRCIVQGGMVGIKLYHQYRICDPAQRPLMERAAALGVPVLMHAGKAGKAPKHSGLRYARPRISDASHFVKAAEMLPDTILIQAHIGGGGEWEWNLRVPEERPDIYIDTSRLISSYGREAIASLARGIGADHVLFGSGAPFKEVTPALLKLRHPGLVPDDREKISFKNAYRLLGMAEAPGL